MSRPIPSRPQMLDSSIMNYGAEDSQYADKARGSATVPPAGASYSRPVPVIRRNARSGAEIEYARNVSEREYARSAPDAAQAAAPTRNLPPSSLSEDASSLPPPPPPRPLTMPSSRNYVGPQPLPASLRPEPLGQASAAGSAQDPASREPPHGAHRPPGAAASAATYQYGLHAQQAIVFVSFYAGYVCYVLNQKSFSYALPYVVVQEYITAYELGLIFSALSLAIAISRPVASVMCDAYSVRLLFNVGLFVSGLICLAFVDSDTLLCFTATALMNGLAQGFGWTPVVKALGQWYHWQTFGTLWAAMTTAESLANAMGHSLSAHLAAGHGWKLAIQVPAMASMLVAAIIYLLVRDRPSECGFQDEKSNEASANMPEGHWSDLLPAPFMWVLAAASMAVACIQTSTRDWAHGYLVHEQSMPMHSANSFLTALEVGGIIGSIFSGAVSDALVRSKTPGQVHPDKPPQASAPRMVLIQIMIASTAVCLNVLLFAISSSTSYSWLIVLAMFIGFSINGAAVLIGIVAVETAPLRLAGAAQAIIFFSGSVGGFMSGVPIITIANYFSWFGAMVMLEIICIAAFMTMVLTKDMPVTFTPYVYIRKEPTRAE